MQGKFIYLCNCPKFYKTAGFCCPCKLAAETLDPDCEMDVHLLSEHFNSHRIRDPAISSDAHAAGLTINYAKKPHQAVGLQVARTFQAISGKEETAKLYEGSVCGYRYVTTTNRKIDVLFLVRLVHSFTQ